MTHALLRTLCFTGLAMAMGCTTIGLPDTAKMEKFDFGSTATLRLCILKDRDVSQERTDEILAALKEELNQYGIHVLVPWIKPWDRPGFWSSTLLEDIMNRPLIPPCDRLFGLSGRSAGDFVWGIILPEWLGMAETTTFTRGFAFVEWGSLNQILSFGNPRRIALHEMYHLLGCGHGLVMGTCYDQIKILKDIYSQERETGNDFFPTISKDGYILRSRDEVDKVFYELIQSQYVPDTEKQKRKAQ